MKSVNLSIMGKKIFGVFVLLFLTAFLWSGVKKGNKPMEIRYMQAQYIADFSDDRALVGAAHNVFVGRVIKQVDTRERGIGPETQFEVEVINNIKGDLTGTVIVNQEGGVKDGVLYVVGEGVKGDRDYILQPNSTYLLATRYNRKENWYTINPYPTATKLLTRKTMGIEDLRSLVSTDSRVKELQHAYPTEIIPMEDIRNNNAKNSYKFQEVND